MITIALTYFKSLTLANLAAALFSVREQDLTHVDSLIVVDNDTADTAEAIQRVIDEVMFTVPTKLLSFKHGDPKKTHPWSTNMAVGAASTPWVLFTRADYLLDFDAVREFFRVANIRPETWDGFVSSNFYHLVVDIEGCERAEWRKRGTHVLRSLPGVEEAYACIDAGVWLLRRDTFMRVGGLDESLYAWGHAQTHFQYRLHEAGVDFIRIPRVMFYHPQHGGARDINLAHEQLREIGVDIRKLWARYEGAQPYGRLA